MRKKLNCLLVLLGCLLWQSAPLIAQNHTGFSSKQTIQTRSSIDAKKASIEERSKAMKTNMLFAGRSQSVHHLFRYSQHPRSLLRIPARYSFFHFRINNLLSASFKESLLRNYIHYQYLHLFFPGFPSCNSCVIAWRKLLI